jgi:hypothetical protein
MTKLLATVGLGSLLLVGGPSVTSNTPIGLKFGPALASADAQCENRASNKQCKRNCTRLANQGKRNKPACDAWCDQHCP